MKISRLLYKDSLKPERKILNKKAPKHQKLSKESIKNLCHKSCANVEVTFALEKLGRLGKGRLPIFFLLKEMGKVRERRSTVLVRRRGSPSPAVCCWCVYRVLLLLPKCGCTSYNGLKATHARWPWWRQQTCSMWSTI